MLVFHEKQKYTFKNLKQYKEAKFEFSKGKQRKYALKIKIIYYST